MNILADNDVSGDVPDVAPADVIVIGAGPAGMSAAITLARHGVAATVLDEQPMPGGQIYRAVEQNRHDGIELGADYLKGAALVDQFRQCNARYLPLSTVWRVDKNATVTWSTKTISTNHRGTTSQARQLRARHVIVASGALERAVPLPGWIQPGVMGAGAAQVVLKSDRLIARNAVLVGGGPLLLLLAMQMLDHGCPPKAIVETGVQRGKAMNAAVRGMLGWRREQWASLAKGASWMAKLRRHGVKHYRNACDVKVLRPGQASSGEPAQISGNDSEMHEAAAMRPGSSKTLIFRCGSQQHALATDAVFLHQGIIPNTQISQSLGLAHNWDDEQRCFAPQLDGWGCSENPLVSIAGDGAGIAGAAAAIDRGALAALNALHQLGIIDQPERESECLRIRSRLSAEQSFRQFLDALYAPSAQLRQPADDVIVCRCEGVTAGDIRDCAKKGCVGPNQTKVFSRCGMGPCQGRYCGLSVTEILSDFHSQNPQATGSYRIRSPLKPVTLGELASLAPPT